MTNELRRGGELSLFRGVGRISRSQYVVRALPAAVIVVALPLYRPPLGSAAALVPSIFIAIQAVKRLHDISWRGWWVVIGAVPLVGPILGLWVVFTKGTIGANQYGPDPLSVASTAEDVTPTAPASQVAAAPEPPLPPHQDLTTEASQGEPSWTERDNLGTRHDSKGIAVAYWMGERMRSTRKDPFVMFTFKNGEDARNALLELPCIHIARDSQKLICTERLIFGYFAIEDVYEAILCGDALTVELWEQATASFLKHGGERKNDLVPTRHAASNQKIATAHPGQVAYVRDERKAEATYRIYRGPDEPSAMAFLQQNPVTQNLLYLIIETPQGNFCRDVAGIYKEDA